MFFFAFKLVQNISLLNTKNKVAVNYNSNENVLFETLNIFWLVFTITLNMGQVLISKSFLSSQMNTTFLVKTWIKSFINEI
jgi:hypothetical protein